MSYDDPFLGDHLVRAFLKSALFPPAPDFVPHVVEGFVGHCLDNPSEAMCQVSGLFYLLFKYFIGYFLFIDFIDITSHFRVP